MYIRLYNVHRYVHIYVLHDMKSKNDGSLFMLCANCIYVAYNRYFLYVFSTRTHTYIYVGRSSVCAGGGGGRKGLGAFAGVPLLGAEWSQKQYKIK